jgi:hypothetical protein
MDELVFFALLMDVLPESFEEVLQGLESIAFDFTTVDAASLDG